VLLVALLELDILYFLDRASVVAVLFTLF